MGRDEERILRFLRGGPAEMETAAADGRVLLRAGGRGTLGVSEEALAALARAGWLHRSGPCVRLTIRKGADVLGARPREVEGLSGKAPREGEAAINWAESPLGGLMRRRGRDGAPFLARREFEAGERLRVDFSRGQMSPRLGANWIASVSSGRRAGGAAELTEAALAARLRVERAIHAVGPELSGVLLDVCCLLKGLEQVESERGWPVRSAKIVLKSALGALARHYWPPRSEPRGETILHWGAADFRPCMDAPER
ncbi:MAG TPA: DUF6456 domain-containing protein [Mesorhizobium sp.]|jgi:hypothetical protein|nr:DUF6456 domain-containing protein [Mesorhizobium sp.]